MKRALLALMTILLLTGCVHALADGGEPLYAIKPLQTFDSRVKLRDKPSRGGSILGQYYAGTPVTILSESDGWAEVRIGSQTGYMMREFLEVTPYPEPTLGYLYLPESDGLITFTGLDGTELRRLEPDDIMVLGTVGDHLLHVATDNFGDRVDGYVASWRVCWTENFSTLTVTADSPSQLINLREAPSMDAPVLARMFPGAVGYRLFDSHTAEDGWTWISFDGAAGYIRDDFLTSSYGADYVPPTAMLKDTTAIVTGCEYWGSINQCDALWILGTAGNPRTPLYLCRVGGWRDENTYVTAACYVQQSEVEAFAQESVPTAGYVVRATCLYNGLLQPEPSMPLSMGTKVAILGCCDAQGNSIGLGGVYGSYVSDGAAYLQVEVVGVDGIGTIGYLPIEEVRFDIRLVLPSLWTNG